MYQDRFVDAFKGCAGVAKSGYLDFWGENPLLYILMTCHDNRWSSGAISHNRLTLVGTLILLESSPTVYCECSPRSSSPALLVLLLSCEAMWIAVHVQEVNLELQIRT
jgi:hypothetical protein